nr:hypothetical protein [Tanacetum cinerariifolium]
MMIREDENKEELCLNMDLLQEKREAAAIREAKYKTKMEQYYNQKHFLRLMACQVRDPHDVKIVSLKQRIKELEFPQLQQDSSAEETETKSNVWDDSFQEKHIVLVEEESCPVYETDNEKEELMPVYDTDIKDVIEEEEGLVEKGGIGGEEDNIEDFVVVASDICYSMIQNTLSIDFEEEINTKSHELMSFGKSIIIKVSQSSFKFLIHKKYQEWYLKAAPVVDKLGFKTLKVRGDDSTCTGFSTHHSASPLNTIIPDDVDPATSRGSLLLDSVRCEEDDVDRGHGVSSSSGGSARRAFPKRNPGGDGTEVGLVEKLVVLEKENDDLLDKNREQEEWIRRLKEELASKTSSLTEAESSVSTLKGDLECLTVDLNHAEIVRHNYL